MRITPRPAPVLDVPVETPTPAPRPRVSLAALRTLKDTLETMRVEVDQLETAESTLDRISKPDVSVLPSTDERHADEVDELWSALGRLETAIGDVSNYLGYLEQAVEDAEEKICAHCGCWKDGPTA